MLNNDTWFKAMDESIGKQLRVKRLKRGLTLAFVGAKLGVSHQQVQKYELAQTRISASMLRKFTDIYGVTMDQFFDEVRKSLPDSSTSDLHGKNLINILVVENNPDDEALTRNVLEQYRPKVNFLCVHDYQQAFGVLRYKTLYPDFPKPNLIILDVSLRKRSGLALLKNVKRDRELQDIPIVVMTNNVNEEVKRSAYKAGAVSYICKPFEQDSYRKNLTDCIDYWTGIVSLP